MKSPENREQSNLGDFENPLEAKISYPEVVIHRAMALQERQDISFADAIETIYEMYQAEKNPSPAEPHESTHAFFPKRKKKK